MDEHKKTAIIFLLLVFLLKPTGLDFYFPTLNYVMNIFKLLAMIFVLFSYIIMIKQKKIEINRFVLLLYAIEGISAIVCMAHKSSPYNVIVYWQSIISLIMSFECYDGDKFNYIKIFKKVLTFYILVNFGFILINPECISTKLFLIGKKNMPILYIFPLIFLIYYNYVEKQKFSVFDIVLLLISYISVFLTNSSTSIIACVLLLLYPASLLVKPVKNIIGKMHSKRILIVLLIIFVLIVVFGVQKYFSDIITLLFNKDITFSGRTNIWDKAIEYIIKNPFGYGWDHNILGVKSILVWENEIEISHAHNFILNLAYKSGIICSVIYVYLLFNISKKIDENSSNKFNILFKVTFLVFLIITTFESYSTNCACIFLLCYIMFYDKTYKRRKELQ